VPSPTLDLSPLWLSLLVAFCATLLIVPIGLWGAWWLGVRCRSLRGRIVLETLLSLPLVLPPTVVGYGLLLVLGRGTALGRFMQDNIGVKLLFTWQGAAVAAMVMALPLFVRTGAAAMANVDRELLEVGRTLGATNFALFRHVLLPLSYRGLLAGLTLAFARALGEFGATLMIAGSIPGRTQTLPLALYAAVQSGDDRTALSYAVILTVFAAFTLASVAGYGERIARLRGEA
jgi:molybdate transport system permease protein